MFEYLKSPYEGSRASETEEVELLAHTDEKITIQLVRGGYVQIGSDRRLRVPPEDALALLQTGRFKRA
jgi:hypothetical protein